VFLHYRFLLYVQFSFRFGGCRTLHKVQSLIFREGRKIRLFALRSLRCRWSSCRYSWISSRFSDIATVCGLDPLTAYCFVACFRPRSLMPLLHSGPIQRLILDVRSVRVLGALLSLTCLWSPCSLLRPTSARWVSLLPVPNSFHGPHFLWV
jgi:hypothetical protein